MCAAGELGELEQGDVLWGEIFSGKKQNDFKQCEHYFSIIPRGL